MATAGGTIDETHVVKFDDGVNVVLDDEQDVGGVVSEKAEDGWLWGPSAWRKEIIALALDVALTDTEAELGVVDVEGGDESVYAVEVGVHGGGGGGGGALDGCDGDVAAACCVAVYRGGEDGERIDIGVEEEVKDGGEATGGEDLGEDGEQRWGEGGGRGRGGGDE